MARAEFAGRLARNALLWILPVAALWLLATPLYNRFLVGAAQTLIHLGEPTDATRLYLSGTHDLRIVRTDIGGGQTTLKELRLTDLHFDWILFGVLLLSTPGVKPARRGATLGQGALIMVAFHLILAIFAVESTYAVDLGDWSLRHYGPFARNLWSLGWHVLDLAFKFALPFALWAAFAWQDMMGAEPASKTPRRR